MAPSFLELLRALERHSVEHVIVGGVAAILEGAPMTTLDLDVVYRGDDVNVERLHAALVELDAVYRDPGGRRIEPTPDRLRANRVNLLETRLGLLDVLQEVGAGWSYEDVLRRSHVLEVEELRVRVIDLADNIATKEAAGREKDRAMLPLLRRTLELKRTSGR
jgi:predicted nucleotidyltransferase